MRYADHGVAKAKTVEAKEQIKRLTRGYRTAQAHFEADTGSTS